MKIENLKMVKHYKKPDDITKMFFDFFLLSYVFCYFTNDKTKNLKYYDYDNIRFNLEDKIQSFFDVFIPFLIHTSMERHPYLRNIQEYHDKINCSINYLTKNNLTINDKIIRVDGVLSLYHTYNNLLLLSIEKDNKILNGNFLNTDICLFLEKYKNNKSGCYWLYALFFCKNISYNPWQLFPFCSEKGIIGKLLYYTGCGTYEDFLNNSNGDDIYGVPDICKTFVNIGDNDKVRLYFLNKHINDMNFDLLRYLDNYIISPVRQ